ncbi:ATP-binding protein [Paenibacillus alvei]|uniref:ATP-binding protein n=4 Tax=Paenibacillus alvei TaxID=44250 RepID=UPI0035576D53
MQVTKRRDIVKPRRSPLNEMMDEMEQGYRTTTSLFADDQYIGTYCCLKCRKEMRRTLVPLRNQWVIATACKCKVAEMEREEKERERKARRTNMERAYSKNIMNEDLKNASFNSFQDREGSESVKQAAIEFVAGFETRKTGLMLFGTPGNGKSHLAAAIHHELDKQGYVCLFLDVSQLFNLAKDTFNSSVKTTLTDIITGAVQCDLLTLDEIGSGYLTEYEFNDILFPIINGRQGKPTNYTTNLDLARLEQWFKADKYNKPVDPDGRLYDRILGSTDIYENRASSKRREDAIQRLQGAR